MSRLFFDDRIVWALCVLLAVVLWVQVTGARVRDVQRTFTDLPVQWRDLPEDMSVLDVSPSHVDITVRGMRDMMQHISRDDFIATVSLTGGDLGAMDYFVTVSVPRGVQLIQVAPRTATVTLEATIEEVYRGEVDLQGEPAVELAEPSVDPQQVVLNGPASRLQRVFRVVAELNIQGLRHALSERVLCTPVDARGNEVRGVIVVPRQVDVHVPQQADQLSLEVPVRPTVVSAPDLLIVMRSIKVAPDEVTVTGAEVGVHALDQVFTERIDMLQLQAEYVDTMEAGEEIEVVLEVALVPPLDERGAEMQLQPDHVTVEIVLEKPE